MRGVLLLTPSGDVGGGFNGTAVPTGDITVSEKVLTRMTDPFDALNSFQQALVNGEIQLQRGHIDSELFVHLDHPNGQPRFTYVRLERLTVTVLVMLVMSAPIGGVMCFQIGYAVPKAYRGQGRAKSTIEAAIVELQHGLSRNKISAFYVEAIVGADNHASKHVAAATLSNSPIEVTDEISGFPAFHYVRKIGENTACRTSEPPTT